MEDTGYHDFMRSDQEIVFGHELYGRIADHGAKTRRSLPAAATTRVEVEGFPVVGATSQSGVLAVTQAADLWVSGDAGRGLRQIDPRDLPDALRSRPSTVLAYAFVEQPFRLSLRVDPSPPAVQVSQAVTVAVVPGEARVTARLDYRLARGRVQEVRIGLPPGWTLVALTGAPLSSSSMRRASVKPRTAAFEALYAPCPGTLMRANTLEMLTTWPLPEALRCGRKAFVPYTTPQKFMRKSHSKSS